MPAVAADDERLHDCDREQQQQQQQQIITDGARTALHYTTLRALFAGAAMSGKKRLALDTPSAAVEIQ